MQNSMSLSTGATFIFTFRDCTKPKVSVMECSWCWLVTKWWSRLTFYLPWWRVARKLHRIFFLLVTNCFLCTVAISIGVAARQLTEPFFQRQKRCMKSSSSSHENLMNILKITKWQNTCRLEKTCDHLQKSLGISCRFQ